VLVDAGGEYHNMVSDISRTWPINGKFSPAQRTVYDAVLQVQLQCINVCILNDLGHWYQWYHWCVCVFIRKMNLQMV
jgi:hypothetical protein